MNTATPENVVVGLAVAQVKTAPPLPATRDDLLANRMFKPASIHDHVEPLFISLWDDEEFRAYFDGVFDADCVEGSIRADEHMAAVMIRRRAVETGDAYLAKKNLTAIVKSLHVVMNRFNLNRLTRRQMVNGEKVAGSADE